MENNINIRLQIIEKSIQWVKETDSMRGAKGENAYRNLRGYRRKLNKKKSALEGNPAAAMYGESQAGKSYLVSALLSVKGNTFKILDGNGNEFDFKNQINPRGNEMESTSLVTRFSTKYHCENKDYPIITKLLSPTDLILVICEAYYHNLNVNKPLSFEELKEKIGVFESIYANKAECQKLIIDDNIDDIEEYFDNNFSKLVYNNIKDANFFEKLSGFVTKIAPEEWKDVFSLFWNFNPQLTKLFDDLIKQYKQLQFTDTVCLPIDAVLRDKGTILDVSRLDEIYDSFKGQETEYSANSLVFYTDKNGNEKTVNFSKPYLCALTAELIFVLPQSIKNDKPFLAQTDLLDFPGLRRFETTNENNITDKSLTVLLRRGKVDYLFNKYSTNEGINALLFCQNHKQSNQSVMPEKLKRWIGTMIGTTPEERETYRSPLSPLFVISTWFNKDLEFIFNEDKPNAVKSLNERWLQRFTKTLAGELIKASDNDWFENWSVSKRNFQNIYLLRDFDKSSETNSQIYIGYNQDKEEKEEIIPDTYPNFRKDLRQSFIEYDFVKQHFGNPENSWDRAASINEDGTQLIIDNLIIVSNNINPARREKIVHELNIIAEGFLNELKKYFHDSNSDTLLQRAKSTAGTIQLKLDSAFGGENIELFGQMMKEIMVDNRTVFDFYEKRIKDIEHRDVVNMDKYSNVRMVVGLEPNDDKGNLERLRVAYEKPVISEHYTIEKLKEEFAAEGVNLDELFGWLNKNYEQVKSNVQVWAEELEKYWLEHCLQNKNHIIGSILSEMLSEMKTMYETLFQKLNISKVIAEKNRRYMDGWRSSEEMHEMIADISAEIINNFIKSVGLDYYDKSNFNDLKQANEKNSLGLILEHSELDFENISKEGAAELITLTTKDNLSKLLNQNPLPIEAKRLPNRRAYILWRDALKAGFVSVCDIPTYDVQANEKLGAIINECETIKY